MLKGLKFKNYLNLVNLSLQCWFLWQQIIILLPKSSIYCWRSYLFLFRIICKREFNLRSCHWNCFVNKGVVINFANFTGIYLFWIIFLIELQASAKSIITPDLNNICKRLLLKPSLWPGSPLRCTYILLTDLGTSALAFVS